MDQTIITYISLLISLVSLGISAYVLSKNKVKSEPKIEIPLKSAPLPPRVISQPISKQEKKLEPKPEPKPTPKVEKSTEIVSTTPVIPVVPAFEHPPIKKLSVNSCAEGEVGNDWYLEATGIEGTKFSIQIEWSDGTSDVVFHGVAPVELEFIHPKGVTPIKVVGIPPYGDRGVSYLWELNGFHWS